MAGVNGLSGKQMKAAQALSRGATRDEAATDAGVSPRTVYRYQHDATFRLMVAELTEQRLNAVRGSLASAGRRSVDVLDGIAQDEDEATGHRIAAARSILQTLATVERADYQRRQDDSVSRDTMQSVIDGVVDVLNKHLDGDEREVIFQELQAKVDNAED